MKGRIVLRFLPLPHLRISSRFCFRINSLAAAAEPMCLGASNKRHLLATSGVTVMVEGGGGLTK